jgi:hypothetical protein
MHRYLVLDTESSVCQDTNRRVLVSLANQLFSCAVGRVKAAARYQVVDVHLGTLTQEVRELHYDIVEQPEGMQFDEASEHIHGITPEQARCEGVPLCTALNRLLHVVRDTQPHAIAGHDIAGDMKLIVSEAVRFGMLPADLAPLRNILCTRELSVGKCRLPLPQHLQYEYPCDILLGQVNGQDPPHSPPAFKWPSLEESFSLLAKQSIRPCYDSHDARGPHTVSGSGNDV